MLSGGALSFFSVVTLVCLGFRRAGILKNSITMEHYHDLGKWLFAHDRVLHLRRVFAIPPDLVCESFRKKPSGTATAWWEAGCSSVSAMPFLRFMIPFFTLLCRPAKRSLKVIALHRGVEPGGRIHRSVLDRHAGVLSRTVRSCTGWIWRRSRRPWASAAWFSGARLKQHKMVPVGDLRFEQSLHFENA